MNNNDNKPQELIEFQLKKYIYHVRLCLVGSSDHATLDTDGESRWHRIGHYIWDIFAA